MGYTSYWESKKNKVVLTEQQEKLISDVLQDHANILEVTEWNPETSLDFNGIGDNSHENFLIEFGKKIDFAFCKTAHKPYDLPVCKILYVLSLSPGFTFSSDGEIDDGQEGDNWDLAKKWFESAKTKYLTTPTKKEPLEKEPEKKPISQRNDKLIQEIAPWMKP